MKVATTTKKGTTVKATTKPTSKGTTKAATKTGATTKKATTMLDIGMVMYDKDFPNGILIQGGSSRALPKTTKSSVTNPGLRSVDILRSIPLGDYDYDYIIPSVTTTTTTTTPQYQEDNYPFFTHFRPQFFNPFLFRQRYVDRSSWWSRMRYGHFSRGQK